METLKVSHLSPGIRFHRKRWHWLEKERGVDCAREREMETSDIGESEEKEGEGKDESGYFFSACR